MEMVVSCIFYDLYVFNPVWLLKLMHNDDTLHPALEILVW